MSEPAIAESPEAAVEPPPQGTVVGSALHLHRHRGRLGVPVVFDDAVAVATRAAVSGFGQRPIRRDRVRRRGFRGVAGSLHAVKGFQPAGTAPGVADPYRRRRGRHGRNGDLVSRLAGPGARFDGSCAPEMVRLPAGHRAVVDRAVRRGRDRPAHPAIVPLPGSPTGSRCAAAGFGRHRGVLVGGADDRVAQRRGGEIRDADHEQHVRGGQQRNESRHRRAEDAAAFRRAAVAGVLGIAGTSGPHLRRGRAHRRPAHRFQRRPGNRTDPRLRRTGIRRRHHRHRGVGRAGVAAHRRTAPRRRRGRQPPPAPAGSTRRKPMRWSTCTTATPRS